MDVRLIVENRSEFILPKQFSKPNELGIYKSFKQTNQLITGTDTVPTLAVCRNRNYANHMMLNGESNMQ